MNEFNNVKAILEKELADKEWIQKYLDLVSNHPVTTLKLGDASVEMTYAFEWPKIIQDFLVLSSFKSTSLAQIKCKS